MKLSLVIPAYNEEKRIGPSVEAACEYFTAAADEFELVLVDDGSRDRTVEVVEQHRGCLPELQILTSRTNMGKGGALHKGMLAATGDYVLFSDADQSTPFREYEKFKPYVEQQLPVIIGTRKSESGLIERHQPWLRENMGKGFTLLSQWIVGVKVTDFTCGFKLFRRDAAQAIFSRQTIRDWSFDSEILFLAGYLGYSIQEVPVFWSDVEDTKVRLIRDTWDSFLGLLKIRRNAMLGHYAKLDPAKEAL